MFGARNEVFTTLTRCFFITSWKFLEYAPSLSRVIWAVFRPENRTRRTKISDSSYEDYTWDYRNRLTGATFKNSGGTTLKTVVYEYDAFNRLIRRTYDADGPGAGAAVNAFWAFDEGINPLLEFDAAAATDVSHRYLWGSQVDQLFADEQVTTTGSAGNALWALGDNLGTIRDIADLSGSTTTITNHRRFGAYGDLVSESNAAVDMLFAFTGKLYDEVTGLQNNLNRWYDAKLGQWMSEDPIGFEAGDANVRRYVNNTATRAIDPTGLDEGDGKKKVNKVDEQFLEALRTIAGPLPYGTTKPNHASQLDPYINDGDWSDNRSNLARGCVGIGVVSSGNYEQNPPLIPIFAPGWTGYKDPESAKSVFLFYNHYRPGEYRIGIYQLPGDVTVSDPNDDGIVDPGELDENFGGKFNFVTNFPEYGNGDLGYWVDANHGATIDSQGNIYHDLGDPYLVKVYPTPPHYGDLPVEIWVVYPVTNPYPVLNPPQKRHPLEGAVRCF